MAQFNLNDYETVAERIKRFYADHPDARIVTKNLTTLQDRQVSTWVVQAKIYLPNPLFSTEHPYLKQYILKATGLAFEIDGSGMANKTSALENAETSAIGRALANANYGGDKRVSREEMAKAANGVTPAAAGSAPVQPLTNDQLLALAKTVSAAKTREDLMVVWTYNSAHLDQKWTNTLGEEVSLRQLIITAGQDLTGEAN